MNNDMSNDMSHDGIRLAYVHLSVTAPRASGPRRVPVAATSVARGPGRRRRDRITASRPAGGLAA